ncbi:MAG: hypothetical protein A2Y79_01490 [Deltaproteobacteria bacterium RBG_13_43_22]|nr:MAG: hypothetical protein A2Y79_01490 [Deltaproteobacteria bacterium RBG_13_43_22]
MPKIFLIDRKKKIKRNFSRIPIQTTEDRINLGRSYLFSVLPKIGICNVWLNILKSEATHFSSRNIWVIPVSRSDNKAEKKGALRP